MGELRRSATRLLRLVPLAAALAVTGCGLLAPPAPPARFTDPVPGADPVGPQPFPDGPAGVSDAPPFPGYRLRWHDEFEGAALDPSRWTAMDRPWKDGVSTPDALEVKDGVLRIRTYDDPSGAHLTGHLGTYPDKLLVTYGYFEARIRFHDSPGMWCSFFVYPPTYGPVGDPADAGVEIDVVEHRAVDGDGYDNSELLQVGINWDGFGSSWKRAHQVVGLPDGAPLYGVWRTYAALWTAEGYTFYVDGIPLWSTAAALSRAPSHVYLVCEVRDASWVGRVPPGGYGSRETSTTWIDVDWVRVWQATP